MDIERLRKPMQQITDYILGYIGEKNRATIIDLNQINQEGDGDEQATKKQ